MRNAAPFVLLALAAPMLAALIAPRPAVARDVDDLARLDFRQVVQQAKDEVFPAVVFIKVVQETHEAGKRQSREVSGSGVIISAGGEVLTNWHVVDKAVEVRCLLFDGTAVSAEVVATDKDLDLGLLQLKLPEGTTALPTAELGRSDILKEGDFVMAMGAPWGLSRSVSIGIISCARRYLPDAGQYSLWLQTDAAISPGNSGGPLVDTQGRVIGINTLGIMQGGDTGFSIPVDTIRDVLPRMRKYNEANWSWLGLRLQPLRDFNRNIYFEGDKGVIVASTEPQSPARRAGIEDRDRLLTINGEPINGLTEEDLPDIQRRIGLLALDQAVTMTLRRGEETIDVELTPRKKGRVEGEEFDCPRWDMTVKTINQFDNPDLFFYEQEGVFIFGIKSPGNAQQAGLRQNDILLKVDGQSVKSLEDVKAIHQRTLENVQDKPRFMVTVLRNGLMRQVILDIARDFERE